MAVESARDLGVYIDLHLTYDTHISHLVSSCLTKLVQINRLKYCFDRKTLVLIITSLVFNYYISCLCLIPHLRTSKSWNLFRISPAKWSAVLGNMTTWRHYLTNSTGFQLARCSNSETLLWLISVPWIPMC